MDEYLKYLIQDVQGIYITPPYIVPQDELQKVRDRYSDEYKVFPGSNGCIYIYKLD